jgi:hypothetical protein
MAVLKVNHLTGLSLLNRIVLPILAIDQACSEVERATDVYAPFAIVREYD